MSSSKRTAKPTAAPRRSPRLAARAAASAQSAAPTTRSGASRAPTNGAGPPQDQLAHRAQAGPTALTPADVQQLQATAGNRATSQALAATPPLRTSGHGAGTHGDKRNEQQRLTQAFGTTVSGRSHESEHVVGYEPLAQTGNLPRQGSKRARELENGAAAYQEVKDFHRAHIGTGTRRTADASGFDATSYRFAQRGLVEAGDVSSAVQLNQLGYAFLPGFQDDRDAVGSRMADDSYDRMVDHLEAMTYADGRVDRTVGVDAVQQAEMYLARRAAQTGQWPSAAEIAAAKRRFGVDR